MKWKTYSCLLGSFELFIGELAILCGVYILAQESFPLRLISFAFVLFGGLAVGVGILMIAGRNLFGDKR